MQKYTHISQWDGDPHTYLVMSVREREIAYKRIYELYEVLRTATKNEMWGYLNGTDQSLRNFAYAYNWSQKEHKWLGSSRKYKKNTPFKYLYECMVDLWVQDKDFLKDWSVEQYSRVNRILDKFGLDILDFENEGICKQKDRLSCGFGSDFRANHPPAPEQDSKVDGFDLDDFTVQSFINHPTMSIEDKTKTVAKLCQITEDEAYAHITTTNMEDEE